MNHVMLDIETLGNDSNAAILSIGAAFFNPSNGHIGAAFYHAVKLSSCQQAGLNIDAGTIEWWMQQSKAARAIFTDTNRVSLKEALTNLSLFIKNNTSAGKHAHVWGNGPSFDNVIINNAYRKTGIKTPWAYYNDRCVRTMVAIGRSIGIDPKKDLPLEGTAHNALDDAIHQAKYVSIIYQAIIQPKQAAGDAC